MRNIIVLVAGLGLVSAAVATPYASGILDLGGGNYSFVLNQAADNVVINRTGDTPLNLGALPKGTYTFSQGAGTAFQIKAYSSTAPGWTQYSDDTSLTNKFYSARGLAVNRNADSSSFGSIYVSNASAGTTASPARTTAKGLYSLRADQSEIISGQTGGVAWDTTASSPWKLHVAPDSRVYIADYSNVNSGVWRAPASLAGNYDEILYNGGRQTSGLVLNPDSTPLHGSIPSVWVEGTGANTKLYTMDEDLPDGLSPTGVYPDERGDIKRYPIGEGTSYTGAYETITRDGTPSPDGVILNSNMDFVRASDGSFWVTQLRYADSSVIPVLSHWYEGASGPAWVSGGSLNFGATSNAGWGVDIDDLHHRLAIASQTGKIFILDISDPSNPLLETTLSQVGSAIRDIAFDAAGNLYSVNSSSEVLRCFSPGGDWLAITGSDGTFNLVPEPASMFLLALGLLLRRR